MSKFPLPYNYLGLATLAALLVLAGCAKKTVVTPGSTGSGRTDAPATTPSGPSQEPTVTIRAEPATAKPGDQVTLSWNSTDAERLSIDNGLGTVSATGSVQVRPTQSTTYTATATNRLGSASASTRVTLAAVDAPPPQPPPPTRDVITEDMIAERVKDVFFDYDASELSSQAQEILKRNAESLRQLSTASFILEGHCDERGTEEYNLALGDRRAQSVRSYLVSLGIPASRMEIVSYGEERPFADGDDESSWAQNRRVHFTLRR